MEIYDAIVVGSRPVALTNQETGITRRFTIFAVKYTNEDEVTNLEIWTDRMDNPVKRGTKVGISQDENERWNIWF